MYANGEHNKYSQKQINLRAEYNGLYVYYSAHYNLSGHNLRLRIAQAMREAN